MRWWDGDDWTDSRFPPERPQAPYTHVRGSHDRVQISLWTADAVTLWNWLQHTDVDSLPVTHPAQRQALADLEAALDTTVAAATDEEVEAAHDDVTKDMR